MRVLSSIRPALPAVLLAGILLGCGSAEAPQGGPPGGARPVTPVVAVAVTQGDFTDSYTALGTARARESIQLTSRIASTVARIHFTEGQWVDTGTLLVSMDNREIVAQRAVAESAVSKARSNFERAKSLSLTRVVSEAEMVGLESDLQRAIADLQAAQARLDDTYIRAPFAGYVGLRRVSVGDLVGPDTVITSLDDTSVIRLEFSLPEVYLANVQPGLPVAARSQVFSGETFTGELVSLDSRIDPVTRAVTAIAAIGNADNRLKPGMFLTVDVQRLRSNVILIPEEALVPRQGRQFVFVVRNGNAIELEVELGSRAPGKAEIRRGLQADDMVVIEGAHKLRDGAAVRLVPPPGQV